MRPNNHQLLNPRDVCTSKCLALRPGPSLCMMALALLLLCPNFNFGWSCSLTFEQMFHIQPFNATFCARLAYDSAEDNDTIAGVTDQ